MPNPAKYKTEEAWMSACMKTTKAEGKKHDQSVAQCLSMWRNRKRKRKGKRKGKNATHDVLRLIASQLISLESRL